MIKKIFFIFTILVVFFWYFFVEKISQKSQFSENNNFVKILAKNKNNEILQESSWWRIADNIVLTALHNVENEQYLYTINNEVYSIFSKNENTDIAFIKKEHSAPQVWWHWDFSRGKVGENVVSYIWRNGYIKRIQWKILAENASIIGVDANGGTKKIVIRYLTDLPVVKGDSGAPIMTEDGKIIDVVHIAN